MNETDFADIEKQKENIQPLKQGRSAKMLALYLSEDSDKIKQEHQAQFEEKLRHLDEEDDPLQVFVSYVQWIENAYSSGPSPLLKVVEKAVRQFKNDARYKNDPRFLKLWLIVAHQAKEPIDVFKYLSINGIGVHLSLYYEEYATLLEKNGRNKEAMDVYKHGVQKGAQPIERLNRRFVEFQKRMVIMPSTSNQDQTQDLNPSLKKGPKKSHPVVSAKLRKDSKSQSKPFAVFNDEDNGLDDGENMLPSADSANRWSEYANESTRVKENRMEPTPWTGVTCPQKPVGKKSHDKFKVFKDEGESEDSARVSKSNDRALSVKTETEDDLVGGILNDKTFLSSKESNLACDKSMIFRKNKECSFEESRYDHIEKSFKDKKVVNKNKIVEEPSIPENDYIQKERELKHCASPTINTKAAMQDVFEMFSKPLNDSVWEDEDETISAKVYRPETFKIGVFHDEEEQVQRQVVDLQSKQPKKIENKEEDDFADLSAKTPKLASSYPLQSTPLVLGLDKLNDPNPPATVIRPSLRPFDIMTPITEVSEDRTFAGLSTIHSDKVRSSISGYDSNASYYNQNGGDNDILPSSFSRGEDSTISSKKNNALHQSSIEVLNSLEDSEVEKDNESNYETMDIPNPCNPYDSTIINAILDSVPIPENSGLYSLRHETRELKEELKDALSRSKSKMDYIFQLGSKQRYKLVKKIAEGGYGQVYLVNNFKTGLLGEQDEDFTVNCTFSSKKTASPQLALKLQNPPAPWEFYILSLLRSRLPNRVNDSVAKPVSCYLFKDESALLMEYRNQGTLLNCVNLANSGGYGAGSSSGMGTSSQSGVDELLAAFWTIELLRIIETIHAAGVIHGDIKPDNVMIRLLDAGSDWESIYRADGTAGWNSKGLSLIDWGSSIDVLSFPEDQKFIKLKSTGDSSIECWQVRNNKAWTYEIDWYGCASVIHILLFGTYMSVTEKESNETPILELKSHFKRYWNSNLWKDIFDLLLNAGTYNTELLQQNISESITVEDSLLGPGTDFEVLEQEFPLIQKIHDKRIEMELWLKASCCSGGPGRVKIFMEARKEQKKLQQQRKMAKPNAPLIQKAKTLWEQLRSKTLDNKERGLVMAKMIELIKGKVVDLIFKHDASRIIQCCLKHGNAEQREMMAQELSGCWIQLATSQYGRFIISKVLTYCNAKYRHLIIKEMAGKVIKLVRHKEAGLVVEELYSGFANGSEKNLLVLDFYGKEFSLFQAQNPIGLKAIIDANPNKKESIQKSLKENLYSILQKDAVSIGPLSILHRVILDYLSLCNDKEMQDVIELLKENLIHIIHTKEGSKVAQMCLLHSSPKNRKIILKSWKGFVTKIAKEEYGHVALITLFECVDDTVLVNKAIISELVKDGLGPEESFCALLRQKYASRVILYLLRGRQKKFLPSHIYEELLKNDAIRSQTSKKDQTLREKELLEFISPYMIDELSKNMNILIRSRTSGQIVAETLRHAIGEKDGLFESLSSLSSIPMNAEELQDTKDNEVFHPIKKMKKEAELSQLQETLVMDDHVLVNRNATYVLKDIISGGSKDNVGCSSFVEILFSSLNDKLQPWIEYCMKNPSKSSGTAFVLLSMLENVSQDLKEELFSTFRKYIIDPIKTKESVTETESKVKKPAIKMIIDMLF